MRHLDRIGSRYFYDARLQMTLALVIGRKPYVTKVPPTAINDTGSHIKVSNSVDIGQATQITMKFRALKQTDEQFIFHELLMDVAILDDGISAVCWPTCEMELTSYVIQVLARDLAEKSARPRSAKREPRAYPVYRRTGGPTPEHMDE